MATIKSIEENEKAYTELINRLEDVKDAIKKQNYGIAMDILCKPYPQFQVITHSELKESEDERIRENIIATIHLYYGEPLEDEAKEMIAWLEKQGEQKPAESINDVYPETLDKAIDLYYYSYGNGNGYFENLSFEKFKDIAKTFVSDYSKQKPAWSEEDEAGLSDAMWAIEQARTIAKDENDMGNLWYAEHWLKFLKERYTWKPSDEQMNTLEYYMHTLVCSKHKESLFGLYADLKKLREE